MLTYEQFYDQYFQINNELRFSAKTGRHEIKSIFEVGCGAGPNLYLYQQDGLHVGGIDYSHSLIDIAKTVLKDLVELICDEAIHLPDTITYDAVLSNSVFSYFDSYEYAETVLERTVMERIIDTVCFLCYGDSGGSWNIILAKRT